MYLSAIVWRAHPALERPSAVAADELLAQAIVLCHAQPLEAGRLALSFLQRPAAGKMYKHSASVLCSNHTGTDALVANQPPHRGAFEKHTLSHADTGLVTQPQTTPKTALLGT